jgi:hypothetical protein
MQRTEVKSQMIKSIGYDPVTLILEVQLTTRYIGAPKVYQFRPVPPELHAAFMDADSKGLFFLKQIKPAFDAKKIEEKVDAGAEKTD